MGVPSETARRPMGSFRFEMASVKKHFYGYIPEFPFRQRCRRWKRRLGQVWPWSGGRGSSWRARATGAGRLHCPTSNPTPASSRRVDEYWKWQFGPTGSKSVSGNESALRCWPSSPASLRNRSTRPSRLRGWTGWRERGRAGSATPVCLPRRVR